MHKKRSLLVLISLLLILLSAVYVSFIHNDLSTTPLITNHALLDEFHKDLKLYSSYYLLDIEQPSPKNIEEFVASVDRLLALQLLIKKDFPVDGIIDGKESMHFQKELALADIYSIYSVQRGNNIKTTFTVVFSKYTKPNFPYIEKRLKEIPLKVE